MGLYSAICGPVPTPNKKKEGGKGGKEGRRLPQRSKYRLSHWRRAVFQGRPNPHEMKRREIHRGPSAARLMFKSAGHNERGHTTLVTAATGGRGGEERRSSPKTRVIRDSAAHSISPTPTQLRREKEQRIVMNYRFVDARSGEELTGGGRGEVRTQETKAPYNAMTVAY